MLILFAALSVGYLIGRAGHYFGGHINAPHHWIYGFVLVVIGGIFWSSFIFKGIALFGLGLFVSDLKDFLSLKFYGPDEHQEKKHFWGID